MQQVKNGQRSKYSPLNRQTRERFNDALKTIWKILYEASPENSDYETLVAYRRAISQRIGEDGSYLENRVHRNQPSHVDMPDDHMLEKMALEIVRERASQPHEKPLDDQWKDFGTAQWASEFLEKDHSDVESALEVIGKAIVSSTTLWKRPPLKSASGQLRNGLMDEIFRKLGSDPTPSVLVLLGDSGMGKTELAKAACLDWRMWTHFSDGIIWVDAKYDAIQCLQSVLSSMKVDFIVRNKTEELRKKLEKVIGIRRMLIVLDNVEQAATIDAFRIRNGYSTILVTTSNVDVASNGGSILRANIQSSLETSESTPNLSDSNHMVMVGRMSEQEMFAAMIKSIPDGDNIRASSALRQLAKIVDGKPFLLGVVRAYLIELFKNQEPTEAIIGRYVNTMHTMYSAEHRKVDQIIERNLSVLPPMTRNLYSSLAIFPKGIPLSLEWIRPFWMRLYKINDQDLDSHFREMERMSLLNVEYDNRAIRLHDFFFDYLNRKCGVDEIQNWHKTFLSVLCPQTGTWADLTETNSYGWNYLVHHLAGCGDTNALTASILNAEYLVCRLRDWGLSGLLRDLRTIVTDDDLPVYALTRLIRKTEAILLGCENAQEIIDTLWQRTAHVSELQSLHRQLTQYVSSQAIFPVKSPEDITLSTYKESLDHPTSSLLVHTIYSETGQWYAATSIDVSGYRTPRSFPRSNSIKQDERKPSARCSIYLWKAGESEAIIQDCLAFGMVNQLVSFSDGERLASSGQDGYLRIWNIRDLGNHAKPISTAVENMGRAISYDRIHHQIIVSQKHGALVWCDAETGKVRHRFKFNDYNGQITAIAFSMDGHYLAVAINHKLVLFDNQSRQPYKTLELTRDDDTLFRTRKPNFLALAFHPSQNIMAATTSNGSICLLDIERAIFIRHLEFSVEPLFSVAFSHNGQSIVIGGVDRWVRVIDIQSEQETRVGRHTNIIRNVFFRHDGNVMSACADGRITIWENRSCMDDFPADQHWDWTRTISFDPFGKQAISVSVDMVAIIWDVTTRLPIKRFMVTSSGYGEKRKLSNGAFMPDGQRFVTSSLNGELTMFQTSQNTPVAMIQANTSRIRAFLTMNRKPYLIAGSGDGVIRVYNSDSYTCERELKGHRRYITALALSPDNQLLITGGRDAQLLVWNTDTWAIAYRLRPALRHYLLWKLFAFYSLAFSADGKWLAGGTSSGRLYLWSYTKQYGFRLQRRIRVSSTTKGAILGLSFNSDSSLLATPSVNEYIKLWDVNTGELKSIFHSDSMIFDCSFHPTQNNLLAVASEHGVIWLEVLDNAKKMGHDVRLSRTLHKEG